MSTVGIDNEELHLAAVGIGVKVLGTLVEPAESLEVRSAGGELDTIASIEIGNPEFGFIDIGSDDVGETAAVSSERMSEDCREAGRYRVRAPVVLPFFPKLSCWPFYFSE